MWGYFVGTHNKITVIFYVTSYLFLFEQDHYIILLQSGVSIF
jgi:hypothetical protein